MNKLRARIYGIVYRTDKNDPIAAIFNYSIITLIILNIIAVILGSFESIIKQYEFPLRIFEIFSVIIFSIEYILRLITSDFLFPKSKYPILKYIFSFMAIIDLLAILPFYLPLIFAMDLRFLRALRLFRLFRILKLHRYNTAFDIFIKIFNKEREKLIITTFVTSLLLIFAASLMYFIENSAQPDKFPNIIASLWWAVATLTTVGYGDIYPITVLGKILSGIIALLGIGLVALPTGIISAAFINEVSNNKKKIKCPHCGKIIKEK